MEQFRKENGSFNPKELQPSIDPDLVAEIILPVVIEKLKVEDSPPENDSEQNILGVVPNESGYEAPEFVEEVNDEDQKDLPLNAVLRGKKYSKITDDQRRDFIDAVENNGEKIIHAAKRFNINYSSAKSILNVFKSEGRSLKKLTRKRNEKDEDVKSPKSQEISGTPPTISQTQNSTNDASTQTLSEGDLQQDNSLLALRDRLLASKSEKRENPYSSLISHDATRYPANLNDFPQQQMANADLNNYISQQGTKFEENKNIQYSTGDSKLSQDYLMASQQGQPLLSFSASSNLGQGISSQQYFSSNLQSQYYQLGGQNQYEPPKLLVGGPNNQNLLLNLNNYPQATWKSTYNEESNRNRFNIPPQVQQAGNSFSSMSYTGPNQAQFTINQSTDLKLGEAKNEVQYVQPVMYLMPPNVNQLNFGGPIYQNIQNYSPHQNTYLYYGQNQNQESQNQNQNTNLKRG